METFYLIDFENVRNDGIANIDSLSKEDHVHIFSTQNALNIRQDVFWLNSDIKSHLVPVRKQSSDMHLVSYLGYLLGIHGKQCAYVIVSNDKDYDNVIKFWKEEGYPNISRKSAIQGKQSQQKKINTIPNNTMASTGITTTTNGKITAGMDYEFSGSDRSELNLFMQHGLVELGYNSSAANRICKYVVAHCNDERMLNGIHNDLRAEFSDYVEVYEDVKGILSKFVLSKGKPAKKENKVRSFFGQHFKKKIYTENKEEIISILVEAKTKQQVNNELLKLYADGNIVSHIYQTVRPLINDLPGK